MTHLRQRWHERVTRTADRQPPQDVTLHMEEFEPTTWAKFVAFDRTGRKVGELCIDFIDFLEDDRRSRHQPWGRYDPKTGKVAWIWVAQDRRRQGIANALFDFARGNLPGIDVRHDPERLSEEGGGWARQAMSPSWRPVHRDEPWHIYDAVIASDVGSRQPGYEVYTFGTLIGRVQSLASAKRFVEEVYGPLAWKRHAMPKVRTVHYYFGPSTEFTEPKTVYIAHPLPRLR